MANIFKSLFSHGDKSVLGVDIGPSSIKIVELEKRRGRAVLKTYGALALGPYAGTEIGRATHLPPEKIAEALVDVLREAKTTTTKCGMSIPMSSSLLVPIEVPTADEKQLAQIIPIEARKYIPIPISEVALDWWVIPKEESGVSDFESAQNEQNAAAPYTGSSAGLLAAQNQKKVEKTSVLLVVIHNEAISNSQEIVRLSGLDASFFEIEIFSTIRAVLDHESHPVMILDMGASSTKLYIVDRGILRVSHIITQGSQDLTLAISKCLNITIDEAEAQKRAHGLDLGNSNPDVASVLDTTLNYIFSEANKVILNYQKKYYKNLSKVVLTGGGAGLKGFVDVVRKELQMEIVPADPFAKVEAPAFLAHVLKEAGPEFAVATGLALRKLGEIS